MDVPLSSPVKNPPPHTSPADRVEGVSKERKGPFPDYESIFTVGAFIEVSFDEFEYRRLWYQVIVRKPINRHNNTLMIEYEHASPIVERKLGRCEDVKAYLIRPTPPREESREFSEDDDVDVFFGGVWCEGVEFEVVAESTYKVFLTGSQTTQIFESGLIRLHREWLGGNSWNPPFDNVSLQRLSAEYNPVLVESREKAAMENDIVSASLENTEISWERMKAKKKIPS